MQLDRLRHRILSIVIFLLSLSLLGACNHEIDEEEDYRNPSEEGVSGGQLKPWSDKPFSNDPDNFQFVIVSDRTGGYRKGIFTMALDKVNLLVPELVVSVGDLIEGYWESEAAIDEEWQEFESFVDKLEMPFYYLPGNHDIWSPLSKRKWEERFGVTYYHHVYKNTLFLHLNTLDGGRNRLSPEQVAYFKEVLKENASVRWTLVFMHEPLWVYEEYEQTKGQTGWPELEQALQDRDFSVYAGHFHYYRKFKRNQSNYYILGTTGGISGLEGARYGGFDHVAWVTMTEQGPRIANLELSGIHADDVSTEESFEVYNPLRFAAKLSATPIFVDASGIMGDGSFDLNISNDAYLPMEIEGYIVEQPDMSFSHASFKRTVPAGERIQIPVNLLSDYLYFEDRLIPIRYKVVYRPEGWPAREQSYERFLPILGKEQLPTIDEIAVDGNLSEWGELSYEVASNKHYSGRAWEWEGSDDASFSFSVAQDKSGNLCLAARIVDDFHAVDYKPAKSGLEDALWSDHLRIWIDARPDPERSLNPGNREDDYDTHLPIGLLAAGSQWDLEWEQLIDDADRMPDGLEAVILKRDEYFEAEIKIPVEYLNEKQGSSWSEVRLQVGYQDRDDKGSRGVMIFWQPRWQTPYAEVTNVAGSGTFVR